MALHGGCHYLYMTLRKWMHFIEIVSSEYVTLMHVCISSQFCITSAVSQLMGSLDSLTLDAACPVLGRIVGRAVRWKGYFKLL